MKIVIKIPDLDYFDIKHGYADNYQRERLVESVKRSIAIPKNHGRLIDADKVLDFMRDTFDMQELYLPIHFKELVIDEIPTIVDAEAENENLG